MSLNRRDFLKIGGAGLLLTGFDLGNALGGAAVKLNPALPFAEQLTSNEFPFPFDTAVFEAAERIYNVRRSGTDPRAWLTDINLLLKPGKKLDVKILLADRREDLALPRETLAYSGVTESLDATLRGYDSPRLHYQVQYREGSGAWRSLPPRSFKLPNGGPIKVVLIGDDHNFDDGDYAVPPEFRQAKMTGDYVVEFTKNLQANPQWVPDSPLGELKNGLLLANAIQHILAAEDPDFIIHLGDTVGIGAPYKWEGLGFPTTNLTANDYDAICRTLWLRQRKIFSGLTPNMPTHLVLGNHDGEETWNVSKTWAKSWRMKYFPGPTDATYPEGGHPEGNYYAFSWGSDADNTGGAQFIILDVTGFCGPPEPRNVEDWTLGADQKQWFENVLAKNEHDWVYACYHHVLGGWPTGPGEDNQNITYGRGPLFSDKDYVDFVDPAKVEQVQLTELAKKYGMRGFIYGHDHIFHVEKIGEGLNKKDLSGICVGSTKRNGEFVWWSGDYWKKFYGGGFKSVPDFFGPSGISRLTLSNGEARVDYVCTGSTPNTNLPSGGVPDTTYSTAVFVNAAPALQVNKTSFSFVALDSKRVAAPQILRIRNSGGGCLHYSLNPQQPWIKVSPLKGSSSGLWSEATVSVSLQNLKLGTYQGMIEIKCGEAGVAPLNVPINLTVVHMGAVKSPSGVSSGTNGGWRG
ncbi:MAG: metallophosphoesterase [Candidatus Aminicenantales bacterium]